MKFTYEQWAAKFGNLQHTNKPLNGVEAGTEYFEQSKQLEESGLTFEQLEDYIRWWRGVITNDYAIYHTESTLTVDPYFLDEKNKPDFSKDEEPVKVLSLREQFEIIRKTYPRSILREPWGIIIRK